jgi:hypothetical protein
VILSPENLAQKISTDEIVILGICRNVEADLAADIARLQTAFNDFSRVHFRIVESDSSDNTIGILDSLQKNNSRFKFQTLGELERVIANRWERIAFCRNTCLQILIDDQDLKSVKYFAVADLDGVNSLLDRNSILSCWIRDDWDICTANQSAPYYDVFALRHKTWSPNDCWEYEANLKKMGVNPILAREQAIYKRQRVIPPHSDWIEVDSAFGGLAIYRLGILGEAKYIGKLSDGSIVCEHVPFHESLKSQGAKIFINPLLINGGWNGHNAPHSPQNRFKRAIKRGIVRIGFGFILKLN